MVLFKYELANYKGTIELTRPQFEGICLLNKRIYEDHKEILIKLEEFLPIGDNDKIKQIIRAQFNRIIKKTREISPSPELTEDYLKSVLKHKVYHRFESPQFLVNELSAIDRLTDKDIIAYEASKSILNLLDE